MFFPFNGGAFRDRLSAGAVWDGTSWSATAPDNYPPETDAGNNYLALCYLPEAEHVVLHSGGNESTYPSNWGETWTWDGTDWTLEDPASGTPFRKGASLGYCANAGHVVLFGGASAEGIPLDDTWTWDGSDWTEESPAHSPTPGEEGSWPMSQDVNGNVVMFPFGNDPSNWGQTWTWDGTDWTLESTTMSPPPRVEFRLAYAPNLGLSIIFGGRDATALANFDDTWGWDGTDWAEITTDDSPSTRFGAALAFDPNLGGLLLHGGETTTSSISPSGDTWLLAAESPIRKRVSFSFGVA